MNADIPRATRIPRHMDQVAHDKHELTKLTTRARFAPSQNDGCVTENRSCSCFGRHQIVVHRLLVYPGI